MKRNPIEVFSEWADLDKDFGMEQNHKEAVYRKYIGDEKIRELKCKLR